MARFSNFRQLQQGALPFGNQIGGNIQELRKEAFTPFLKRVGKPGTDSQTGGNLGNTRQFWWRARLEVESRSVHDLTHFLESVVSVASSLSSCFRHFPRCDITFNAANRLVPRKRDF